MHRQDTPIRHEPGQDASHDPTQLDVIRILGATPRVSQRTIASTLGMSLGKVNYCIRALVDKGFVKAENYRNSDNKLGYLYLLTPSGITAKAELTRYFLALKMREYEALHAEIEILKSELHRSSTADAS